MLRSAAYIARRNDLAVLVTGDNLAQVAPQTLPNLLAQDHASPLPIFRPLLTYTKQEIIDWAVQIETYEPSITEYKDCCSLVAKHPETHPKIDEVMAAESELPIENMIDRVLEETTLIRINN